jgi:hypothetical protein
MTHPLDKLEVREEVEEEEKSEYLFDAVGEDDGMGEFSSY